MRNIYKDDKYNFNKWFKMGGVTMDEDYEILPHQILADLKSEVEALKKK